jgi:serine/threonine protein phosphatase PrpC
VVKNNKVYAANAGDSKGVICSFDKASNSYKCRKINHKFNANSKKE